MSTIDSFINSSSILFANDICKGLNLEEKTVMMISRAFAIFITLVSLLLAFKYNNLISLILSSASFYGVIVSVPLILAILGFRSTKKSLLTGMSASFCTIVLWKIFSPENGIDGVIPGMLVNLVFFIGSHYILKQEGGWKRNFNKNGSQKRKTQAKQVKNFSFLEICHKNTPKSESTYIFVSIFCIIAVFSGMYSIPLEKRLVYNEIIEIIYHSVLVITTLWLIYPLWPQGLKSKGFVFIFWLFSLLYILSFVVGLQVLISDLVYFQLVILLLSMTVLSIVARWEISLVLMIFGIIASIQFFKYYTGNNISANFGSVQFKILYILMMVFGILIAFFKPKQDHQEATEAKVDVLEEEVTHLETKVSDLNETVIHYSERISDQEKEIERLGATAQRILNNVNHELRLPVGNVMNFAEMLNDGLGKLNENQLKMLLDEVYKNSNRLSSMIMNMLDLATLEAKKIELDKKKINLGELVEDRINNCRKIYLDNKKIDFVLKIDTEILISVDPNYMRQVVDNLLINSIKFSSEGIIRVELLKKKGLIEFKIKDNGIGIPKEELYDIFTPFKMGSNTQSKAEGRGIGLAMQSSHRSPRRLHYSRKQRSWGYF
jgi:signal transduction histidine kinase